MTELGIKCPLAYLQVQATFLVSSLLTTLLFFFPLIPNPYFSFYLFVYLIMTNESVHTTLKEIMALGMP